MNQVYTIEQHHDRVTLEGIKKRLKRAFSVGAPKREGIIRFYPHVGKDSGPKLYPDEFRVLLYPLL